LPGSRRVVIPRAAADLLGAFGRQINEVLVNAVAAAVDDGLERVEAKVQEGLERVKHARGVAQERSRRGRIPR
jgi:hypothetical protein